MNNRFAKDDIRMWRLVLDTLMSFTMDFQHMTHGVSTPYHQHRIDTAKNPNVARSQGGLQHSMY